jgi:hypothetical protein
MGNILYVFRYFRVVPPIPALMTSSFVVITLVGAFSIAFNGHGGAAAAIPVIVLQAFGASTGFSASARRGYFDLLLARGEPRARIAFAQWLTAIMPGMLSWASLVVVQTLVHGTANNQLMASGTLMALLMASTIPWAVTVGLPRFSGAIGWLMLVCLKTVSGIVWPDPVHDVVFPIDVIGKNVTGRPSVLVPATLISLISLTIAVWWVHRTDIRLEAAQ